MALFSPPSAAMAPRAQGKEDVIIELEPAQRECRGRNRAPTDRNSRDPTNGKTRH
ncbi:MAG: hypothetical protein IKP58_10575 [Victivallales bacterium]|nr:hypothetical protein [Victivallales bacterium]